MRPVRDGKAPAEGLNQEFFRSLADTRRDIIKLRSEKESIQERMQNVLDFGTDEYDRAAARLRHVRQDLTDLECNASYLETILQMHDRGVVYAELDEDEGGEDEGDDEEDEEDLN